MNKFYTWLVVSSANPDAFSATLKGILLTYVAVIVLALQYFKVPLSNTDVVEAIGTLSAIAGGLLGIFGLIRKFYFEVKSWFPTTQ